MKLVTVYEFFKTKKFHFSFRVDCTILGGGCSILLDAYSPRGGDCPAIPGVASVS
jgi:hypothetical protein